MPGAFSKFWEYIGLRLGFSSGADRNAETPPLSTEQRDEQAVFLAAIKAAPLDDAPRLIYADWLEEQDGASRVAHARFIRASCAFSQRWLEDGAREAATPDDRLLEAWGDEWETEFPAPAHPFERHWRRGFPELIVSQWAPDAGHLSAACWPCLTSWHFGPFQSDDRERFEKLARHRELEHL
ncbi:MAG TPA: TIGR02996 domain-containing protein, partial [Pirellulales bacterium]